jgi:hypothetical protein
MAMMMMMLIISVKDCLFSFAKMMILLISQLKEKDKVIICN